MTRTLTTCGHTLTETVTQQHNNMSLRFETRPVNAHKDVYGVYDATLHSLCAPLFTGTELGAQSLTALLNEAHHEVEEHMEYIFHTENGTAFIAREYDDEYIRLRTYKGLHTREELRGGLYEQELKAYTVHELIINLLNLIK